MMNKKIAGLAGFHSAFIVPRSALFPGQPFVAPAGRRAAVVLLVEFAFEAMQHVPDFCEARFLERAGGIQRAIAAVLSTEPSSTTMISINALL